MGDKPAHTLEQLPEPSRHGGVRYAYRGAVIHANEKGGVSTLEMPGHPMDGTWKGAAGTWTVEVDWWVDHGTVPPWRRKAATT